MVSGDHTPVRIRTALAWLSVLVIVAFCAYTLLRGVFTRVYPIRHREIVAEAASLFEVDPFLILSVMRVESHFDSMAVSPRGAVGLMQVMPDTAEWIVREVRPIGLEWIDAEGVASRLHDPRHNILIGSWYLSYLVQRFGDVRVALAAYNSGQGRVSTWLEGELVSVGDEFSVEDIPFAETRDFVKRVLAVREWYERVYRESKDLWPERTTDSTSAIQQDPQPRRAEGLLLLQARVTSNHLHLVT